jgi:organic radical activating enzyme
MTSIRESLKQLFAPKQPLEPGHYSYTAPPESDLHYRLNLRLEEDGSGVLIVNAATILHLNQTAAEYAYHLIQEDSVDQTAAEVAARYRINQQQAAIDYQNFKERILTLINTPDLDPISYLDFDRTRPFVTARTPYRLDVALTYQLPAEAPAEVAPHERVSQELSTAEWRQVIDKTWEAGIPHLVFTGGEPVLRPDLPELLNLAEQHGMVTGLITASLKLMDESYLDALLLTGLDHLMLVIDPDQESYWELLEKVLPLDLFTAVHLTLTEQNAERFAGFIERLTALQPNALSVSASHPSLHAQLDQARERAADSGLELVWELPVPYMHLNPVTQEVGEQRILDGAGKAWLYIEPDGDVLPDQSIDTVLGNILTSSFKDILRAAQN